MKQIKLLSCIGLGLVMTVSAQSVDPHKNYCYNGNFDSEKGNLDGWNVNYDWTGNKHQQGNHNNVSYLPVFRAKKNVLKMAVPSGYESKIECPLIEYAAGDRYKCTFDIYIEGVNMKMLFNGYKYKPGIKPYEHPKLQDMRRIYKTEQIDMKKRSGWQTKTIYFPGSSRISSTAYSHLKMIRGISLSLYVPGATYGAGNFYLSNVRITKVPGKVTVKK